VTHELKTPLAAIQLAADTLVQGRYESPETIRRYSSLLSRESRHLGRLVDNLLAYAQLSDVAHAYAFETQQVCDLVDDALERFQARLSEQHFTVDLDVPSNLPSVRADRSSVLLALDNVIDNAIRYADRRRLIRIRAEAVEQNVAITVEDRGIGIRGDEIERVPERFFRGRNVKGRGSGLGLAITRRIIEAHGGVLGIDSRVGYGTAVELTLPQSRAS
jgi:signal transduction histidine kinase